MNRALSLFVLSLVSSPALAATVADCASGEAPSTHSSATCDAGEAADICQLTGTDLTCQLDRNYTSGVHLNGSAVAVAEYGGSGPDFSMWGTTTQGNDFCCTATINTSGTEITRLILEGGDAADTLDFVYGTSDQLEPSSSYSSGDNLVGLMLAEEGQDTLTGSDSTAINYTDDLRGGSETDTIYGGAGGDHIWGDSNPCDVAISGADFLYGGAGDDQIQGCQGDDYIEGGLGDDWLEGGPGVDTIYGYHPVLFTFNSDSDDIFGDSSTGVLSTDRNDYLYGNAGVDTIDGGGGDDEIDGGPGDDILLGQDGDDDMWGGTGDDVMLGDVGLDEMWGDDGDDLMLGEGDDDEMYGGDGDDEMWGDDGVDVMWGEADNDELHGGGSADIMRGNDGADVLCGDDAGDDMYGNAGPDVLWGGAMIDTLRGGGDIDACSPSPPDIWSSCEASIVITPTECE